MPPPLPILTKTSMEKNVKISGEECKNNLLVGKDKTHFELVYFIVNTLHHIVNSGYWYCYCQNLHVLECYSRHLLCLPMQNTTFCNQV